MRPASRSSLVSGRTRAQLQEAARIFGADGFIAEMGAIIGWDHGRRSSMITGQTPPEFTGPLVAQLESLGLVDALLVDYEGLLEHHAPWHLGHETDVMLHGRVDVDGVNKWLVEKGFGWLVFVDNGRLHATVMDGLDGPPHIYHLMARGHQQGHRRRCRPRPTRAHRVRRRGRRRLAVRPGDGRPRRALLPGEQRGRGARHPGGGRGAAQRDDL